MTICASNARTVVANGNVVRCIASVYGSNAKWRRAARSSTVRRGTASLGTAASTGTVRSASDVLYSEREYLKAYKRATRDPEKDNEKRKARPSYGKRKAVN